MRTRKCLNPISMIMSLFLLLIILGVSLISFIELGVIAIWDLLVSKK